MSDGTFPKLVLFTQLPHCKQASKTWKVTGWMFCPSHPVRFVTLRLLSLWKCHPIQTTAKSQLLGLEAATVGSQSLPVFLPHLLLGPFKDILHQLLSLLQQCWREKESLNPIENAFYRRLSRWTSESSEMNLSIPAAVQDYLLTFILVFRREQRTMDKNVTGIAS